MPELPEVHTTVTQLKKRLPGLAITNVWSRYDSSHYREKKNIKDKRYFKTFKKEVSGKKIHDVERRGKFVLIHLSDEISILVHMKMTGHLLYGTYRRTTAREQKQFNEVWVAERAGPLRDPFNRFVHLVFSLSNGKHLVLSDMRKFASVFAYHRHTPPKGVTTLGPDPLDRSFTFKAFLERLPYASKKTIKQILLDQTFLAGIGNIYSDEILWSAGVHPHSAPKVIPRKSLYKMYSAMKNILRKGVDFGGDSTSDYRQPDGTPGSFHYHHKAYRETGKPCPQRGCKGVIRRTTVGGRGTHYCDRHQVLYR